MNRFIPALIAAMPLAMVAKVGPEKAVEKLQVIATSPRCRPRAARSLQAANRMVTRLGKRRQEWVMEGVEGVLLLCRSEKYAVVTVVSPFLHSSCFGCQARGLRWHIWSGIGGREYLFDV